MATEPRTVPVPYPAQPPRDQFAPGTGSPLLQGSGQADTRVTIRMRPGAGIGVEYLGESVKLSLDASTLGEMPPGYDGQYWTIVYDPETGMTWRVEAIAGGAIPAHKHPESDITNLVHDLEIRPIDAPEDGGIYGRQNGFWVSTGGAVRWDDIQGVPDTFPPELPIPISGVDGLQEVLTDIVDDIETLDDTKLGDAPSDGKTYGRKNAAWEPAAGAAQISDSAPAVADDATFWWDSDAGGLYIRYRDVDSVAWIQVGGSALVNAIGEAPIDGKQYARKDADWSEVESAVEEAPLDGEQYVRQDGAWEPVDIPEGGSSIVVGDAPPAVPQPNSLWWESDTGSLFLRYDDGNTSQYVQVNGSRDAYNPIRLNPNVISVNTSIPTGYNGMTAGPITIASGVTVDVASGSTWTVV